MKKILMGLLIVLIIVIGMPLLISYSKYASRIKSSHVVSSSKFYFTSNYLTTTNPTYEIYTDKLSIDLYNYDVENVLNVSDDIVFYNTSIKYYDEFNNLVGTELNRTDETTYINDDYGKKNVLELDFMDGSKYAIVSVNSTSLFEKNILAKFNFNVTKYVPTYSVNELSNGFTVKIMSANEMLPRVELNWPNKCAPDNTNPLMSAWTNNANTNYLLNLDANTTYSLNFYCTLETVNPVLVDNETLTNSSITVTLE